MTIRASVWLFVCLCSCVTHAQDSLLTKTLNFEDVSSVAINQLSPDAQDYEKKIDFADYDNDGDLDVVISGCRGDFGQRRNKLYRNDSGVLNEVSGSPVIPEFDLDDMSRACLFKDFDNDGFADIVVVCDSNSGTNGNSAPGRTKFLRNVNGQTFENQTERLANFNGAAGDGVAADFDQNGLLDLALVNHPNLSQDTLALNGISGLEPGNFLEVTDTHMPIENEYGGQIRAADMNGDGLLDILVSNNLNDPDAIYFNNNNQAGAGPGDFRYSDPGSILELEFAHNNAVTEQMLLPADFDNDGRMDFFYSNAGPGTSYNIPRSDEVWRNTGNNDSNLPTFQTIELNEDILARTTRAEVADLDDDGRQDLIVVSRDRRPYIFRNTTENGMISFLAWTPSQFNDQQFAWGIGAADLRGNGRTDILIGAIHDEYLFESVPSPSIVADDLTNGKLPVLLDQEPIQITGEAGYGGVSFDAGTLPADARVSILLRSYGDMRLQAIAAATPMLANRPGHSTDQYLQFVHPGGELKISVVLESPSFDGNGDGLVNLLDVPSLIDCILGGTSNCEPFDTDDDGQVTLLDVGKFIDRLSASPLEETYSLEILVRSN